MDILVLIDLNSDYEKSIMLVLVFKTQFKHEQSFCSKKNPTKTEFFNQQIRIWEVSR